jgi:hypothetical protein
LPGDPIDIVQDATDLRVDLTRWNEASQDVVVRLSKEVRQVQPLEESSE